MPSQEEYLDNLLKDIMTETRGDTPGPLESPNLSIDQPAEPVVKDTDSSVEAQAEEGEEIPDIDVLLQRAREEGYAKPQEQEKEPELAELLGEASDAELKDIGDMLDKAEKNEAVDQGIVELLEQEGKEYPVPDIETEDMVSSSEKPGGLKEKLAALKEKNKEKKARKREQREAKKAAKEEEKTKQRAEKEAKKGAAGAAIEEKGAAVEEKDAQEDLIGQMQDSSEIDFLSSANQKVDLDEILNSSQPVVAQDDIPQVNNLEEFLNLSGDMEESVLGELGSLEDLVHLGERPDNLAQKIRENKQKEKKSFFEKLIDFFTEEDEPEEEAGSEIILSDENDAILKELDGEQEKQRKGKKGKKEKNKKNLQPDEDPGDLPEKKAQKQKKQKKPRKVPNLKPAAPEKKLSRRRVSLIFLICITLGVCLLIVILVTADYADKKRAAAAYYEEDYETCYQYLMGKELNESQQVMLGKSESILRIRLWKREYEMFADEGAEPEALDSLLLSVRDYPKLYSYSNQWNATFEVQEIYSEILKILEEKYGLTKEEAEKIANLADDVEYSKIVRAIAGGSFEGEIPSGEGSSDDDGKDPDLLPEEEELKAPNFTENNG